jgi:RNA polymerase sigma-70 factor (ECF subfamily)
LDDRQLVQKLLAKDREAENYFFRAYRDKLYNTSVHFLGYQDPEAEDVTQEAFLRALHKLSEFEFRSSLYTWLFRICVNLCYERIRKRKRQVAHLEEELETLTGPEAVSRQEREEENAEKNRLLELVETQKGRLGEFCRGLLEQRDRLQKSYAEISLDLKVPMGTVMSRISRCREALKRLVLEALQGKRDG